MSASDIIAIIGALSAGISAVIGAWNHQKIRAVHRSVKEQKAGTPPPGP